MLMYMFHIAIALGLVALVMGLKLCKCCGCKAGQCDANCKISCCTKICGYIVVALATISLLCTIHAGYMHMKMGDFGQGMVINLDMIDMTMEDQKPGKKGK